MQETKFEQVSGTDVYPNNGLLRAVRGGKIVTYENGKKTGEAVELSPGLVVEGTYIASSPNRFNPDRMDFVIRGKDGGLTILAETAALTKLFKQINVGELIQVEYNGRREIKRKVGGNVSMHDYKILRAVDAAG